MSVAGHLDIVFGLKGEPNQMLKQNEDGTFTAIAVPDGGFRATTSSVALADVDNDGARARVQRC